MTDIINDVNKIENRSDEHVNQYYENALAKEPTNVADKVADIIKCHKHEPNESDPDADVQEYVFVHITDLNSHGGAYFLNNMALAESVINILANGLKLTDFK